MPAEWENPRTILMAYPNSHTDWGYILEEAKQQFDAIIDALIRGREFVWVIAEPGSVSPALQERIENNEGRLIYSVPFNDTWTRDYGALSLIETDGNGKFALKELDFGFNGWGLKFAADRDNLVNLRLSQQRLRSPNRYVNNRDFTLEGGSIETDGKGTFLTTSRCLCSPNRNGGKSKAEIETVLAKRLGAKRVLWLDYGFLEGDDTDSHIDTLARMAPEDTIVYVGSPDDRNDIHYEELKRMERQLAEFKTAGGRPYRLVSLPFPDAIFDEDGARLPATYANYLVTGWNLYMPVYGQPANDGKAREALQNAFPAHRIYEVDCSTLIKQHGSLHCSTMQLY